MLESPPTPYSTVHVIYFHGNQTENITESTKTTVVKVWGIDWTLSIPNYNSHPGSTEDMRVIDRPYKEAGAIFKLVVSADTRPRPKTINIKNNLSGLW